MKRMLLALIPATIMTVVVLLLYIPTPEYYFFSPDQGFQLSFADQILAGVHPWIDIQGVGYGPLIFYSSALGQLLFKHTIAGEIFITFTGYLVGYLLFYLLMLRVSRSIITSLVLLLSSLFLFPEYYKYYVVLGPAVFIWGMYAYRCTDATWRLWALAAATMINGLYRFDFGVYSVIPCLLVISFTARSIKGTMLEFVGLAWRIAACASPWLLLLLVKGGLFTAVNHIYVSLSGAGGGLVLPNPTWDTTLSPFSQHNAFSVLYYAYPVIAVLVSVLLFVRRKALGTPFVQWMIASTVFGLFTYNHALHRTSVNYMLQVAAPFMFLLAFVIGSLLSKSGWRGRNALLSAGIAAFAALILVLQIPLFHYHLRAPFKAQYAMIRYDWRVYFHSREAFVDTMSKRLPKDGHRYWMVRAVQTIREETTSEQRVLIYPYYPQLYFWSERLYGADFPHVAPRVKNIVEIQHRLIKAMKNQDLPIIVDNPTHIFDGRPERNAHIYAPILMDYIKSNYQASNELAPAVVYRKEVSLAE